MKKLFLLSLILLGMTLPPLCQATPPPPPPTLTAPRANNVGANQATLLLKSSGTGTGYFTLLAGSGTPCGTGTQVKSGQTAANTTAPYHGSLPLFANVSSHYTVRNLTQSTPYTVCFTADDGTNLTATATTANVTTTAAATRTSPAWGPLGTAGFSGSSADYTSLAFAPDGTPYVAYSDSSSSGFVTVKRFNSNGYTWDVVGSAGFSTDVASYTSLAFAPDGTPYVAYQDATDNVTVKMFNGASWSPGGSVSSNVATYISLAFAPDGTPYVAYQDATNNATVMKFNGTWSAVGSIGSGSTSYISLVFAPNGTPYVAYQNNGGSAVVMKYNSGSWSAAGTGLSGIATYPSLAIAPDGTMYLTYKADDGQSNYSVAMTKLDSISTSWSAPITVYSRRLRIASVAATSFAS